MSQYKKDCFAYKEKESGGAKCQALRKIDCAGCKFYKPKKLMQDEDNVRERTK